MKTENNKNEALNKADVISRLLSLKRYETSTCSGSEGSGSVWTELYEDKDGELVKFEDIQIIIDWLNGL